MQRPNHRLRAAIRNRINRYRGQQFEYFVRRKLISAGFDVSRVQEADGFTHGVDLLVRLRRPCPPDPASAALSAYAPPLPRLVPVQVKRTDDWKDLFVALHQCRQNSPGEPLCVAVHGWAPKGQRRPRLTVAISDQPDKPFTMQIITLQELIDRLKSMESS